MIRAGIFGASGYTGVELVKILLRHPQVEIVFATSDSYAGRRLSEVLPGAADVALIAPDAAPIDRVDVAFLALPHGAAAATAQRVLAAGARVVDLSADFRLQDATAYAHWYGAPHHAPELLAQAVYGLPELHRVRIRDARLIANPGCYPTSVILGLAPLLRAGASAGPIVADSKSGVTGAGRKPSLTTHFVEVNENLAPYNIGRAHRHLPEMEQELRALDPAAALVFSPHLVPVNRGILSTMYVTLRSGWDDEALRQLYADAYAAEPFVRVLPAGQTATLSHSVHTNLCCLSIHVVAEMGQAIICSSIDNLIKGASGQAVQNLNLMFGFDETTALL